MYRYLSFLPDQSLSNKMSAISAEASKMHDPMSDFTIARTYSRNKFDDNGELVGRETKDEIFKRSVCGTFSLLADRLRDNGNYYLYEKRLDEWALRMYSGMWNRRFTPPGRGLWSMGTELINREKMGFPLINCTFITSENISEVKWEFFHYVMDTLMLGVGVGYDTKGAGGIKIHMPVKSNFKRYDDHYLLADKLKSFSDIKFATPEGQSYIDYEIEYISNLELAHHNCYRVHTIEDSREGWCDALVELLKSYMVPGEYFVVFDYSKIRPEGAILKKFGGKSSGPKPLAEMLAAIRYLMQEKYLLKEIDELFIIDVCNIIARTVVAGNVRRSSQICISTNSNVIECKCYSDSRYAYRKHWGWGSNNSYIVDGELSDNKLDHIMKTITKSGEPGLVFDKNGRIYGRIVDGINNLDYDTDGPNPCGEIRLKGTLKAIASTINNSAGGETCNLSETIPSNYGFVFTKFDVDWDLLYIAIFHRAGTAKLTSDQFARIAPEELKLRSLVKDYLDDLFIAVLYPKIVTLVPLHWKSSNQIQEVNRRIGVSMTGIVVLLSQMGLADDEFADYILPDELLNNGDTKYDYVKMMMAEKSMTFKRFAVFLDLAYRTICKYDEEISAMLKIPKSIKKTTVKPSGTVSIVNSVPSGMHFPYSNYYMRRIRVNKCETELLNAYNKSGYIIEEVIDNPNTVAITFPVKMSDNLIARDKVNVDLQFKILAYLQYFWSDNQVSCTITFREDETPRLRSLIVHYSGILKGLAFYPYFDEDKYYDSLIETRIKNGESAESARREVYRSLPNERIDKAKYESLMSAIKPVDAKRTDTDDGESDMYCDGDTCTRR